MGIRRAVTLACTSMLVTGALLTSPLAAFADVQPTAAPAPAVAAPVTVVDSAAPAANATPPQDVNFKKKSESKATLSWTAAVEADGSAPHYKVEVTFAEGKPFTIEDTTETSATISIQPGDSATAKVTDIAQDTSTTSSKYEQPAIAPDAPKSVNVTARDLNYASKPPAVRAVWTAPEADGGSKVKQYRTQLFAGKGGSRQLVDSSTVSASTFSHTFSNLEFETFYVVEVSAINGVGTSTANKSNQVKTVAEPEASSAPKPTVTVSTPTTISTPSPSETPTPTSETVQQPATPSPTPTARADSSDLLFVALLPIIVLLLIAAIIALVFVVRYNRRVDAENRAREVRDVEQGL